ncbi:MAG TPA: hypothetical protein VNU68_30785 [Verrucomicrobiae bacterium]|nr:hypothetical protein [Verrucomicrobiae bacterium]
MNKLMAILFLLGAIGGFGLSQRESYQTQSHTWTGTPVGEPRTVHMTRADRVSYVAFGVVCMAGCLYFGVRIRREVTDRESLDHSTRMRTPSSTDTPPEWRMVHFREYSESLDLLGRDLIRMLGRPKEDVVKLVGPIVARSEMQTEELPGEYVTSMTGEVADEVHEWPKATLGPEFRHLMLQFRDGRLIHITWKFQTGAPSRNTKAW